MKCYRIFLLVCYISLIFASSYRKTKFGKKDNGLESNSYYKFTKGIVNQMGGNQQDIEACLPGEWKTGKSQDAETSLASFDQAETLYISVLNTLTRDLDIECKFKSNLKDYFKKKAGVRRYRRVFVELKDDTPFDKISQKTSEIYAKFKETFKSPIVLKIDEFLTCLKTAKSAIVGVINTAKSFLTQKKKILNELDIFIDLLVELVCSREEFANAFTFYKNGVASTDVLEKWFKYGKFIGKLIHMIGMIDLHIKK